MARKRADVLSKRPLRPPFTRAHHMLSRPTTIVRTPACECVRNLLSRSVSRLGYAGRPSEAFRPPPPDRVRIFGFNDLFPSARNGLGLYRVSFAHLRRSDMRTRPHRTDGWAKKLARVFSALSLSLSLCPFFLFPTSFCLPLSFLSFEFFRTLNVILLYSLPSCLFQVTLDCFEYILIFAKILSPTSTVMFSNPKNNNRIKCSS